MKISIKLISILIGISIILFNAPAFSETKFISGYNDGFSVYAIIERDGKQYRTDEYGTQVNQMLWDQLNEEDRRKLLKIYWSPNDRISHFGKSASDKMADWINDKQGWTSLIEKLKQKHANKEFPELKKFYESELVIPSFDCPDEEIKKYDLFKEYIKLRNEIPYYFSAGKSIYQKLVNVKWNQVSVAVKGISAELIPIIVDNFMADLITQGASEVSELIDKTYQFAEKLVNKVQSNKDVSPADIIKDLEELISIMETDATTAKEIVNQKIEKLKNIVNELNKACEEITKNKKEKLEQYKENIKKTQSVGKVDIVIVSDVEKEEESANEIRAKAIAMYRSLNDKLNDTINEYKEQERKVYEELEKVKAPMPPIIETKFGELPLDINSSYFSMHYSVSEIRSWEQDFPRAIEELNKKIENLDKVKKMAQETIDTYVPLVKEIQEQINGLVAKYGGFLEYGYIDTTVSDTFQDLNGLIPSLEEQKILYEGRLKLVESSHKIVKEGLNKRISWQKESIRPYDSLETNFINSYSQVIDAVQQLGKLHSDEFFKKFPAGGINYYRIDYDKIKVLKAKILLIDDDTKREEEVEKIVKKLKEIQKEENHQIRRLTIGQNNADSDYALLWQFLENYTQGADFEKVKKDTLEVTGVKIKHPYFDIVREMSDNTYLWKTTSGWMLNPDSFRTNIDEAIMQITGENEYYYKLLAILEEVNKNGRNWLNLKEEDFRKEYNSVSEEAYKIVQSSGETAKNSPVSKVYTEIVNKIISLSDEYYQRKRLSKIIPELSEHLNKARNTLSKNDIQNYKMWIEILENDIKPGSEADKLKSNSEINKLIADIQDVIKKMKLAIENQEKQLAQQSFDLIKAFYDKFKSAYESKNDSQVMSFISDKWSAGDGTTLSDLQENLRNSFSVFNEIRYNISNLNIEKLPDGSYKVTYDVTITGRIYENNIKHEEKSLVSEIVVIDKSGKVKIFKTLSGRFWYIE